MRAVCKHWGWKLFTPNIWQVGNNNKKCSQNSRAVCNQNVCVFIVYIIELRSWLLWRWRVRKCFLAVACSCAPCSLTLLHICKRALFQGYWHFFRHWDLSSWRPGQDTWLWQERIYWIIICTFSWPKSSQTRWRFTYYCCMAYRIWFFFCKPGIF